MVGGVGGIDTDTSESARKLAHLVRIVLSPDCHKTELCLDRIVTSTDCHRPVCHIVRFVASTDCHLVRIVNSTECNSTNCHKYGL